METVSKYSELPSEIRETVSEEIINSDVEVFIYSENSKIIGDSLQSVLQEHSDKTIAVINLIFTSEVTIDFDLTSILFYNCTARESISFTDTHISGSVDYWKSEIAKEINYTNSTIEDSIYYRETTTRDITYNSITATNIEYLYSVVDNIQYTNTTLNGEIKEYLSIKGNVQMKNCSITI